ncbi:MAG: hypothetical protein ABI432_12740 [Flavobacteriales bacterium]
MALSSELLHAPTVTIVTERLAIASEFRDHNNNMRLRYSPFILLLAASPIAAQDIGERELVLNEVQLPGMPGVQSFAWGQDAGQWFVIGGRVDGLHRRQPFAAFLAAANNTTTYVIDPATEQVWSASIATLPQPLLEQLQSTNMEFIQSGQTLYVIGGYGYSPTAADHITHPNLTAIDLPGVMDAIRNAQPIAPHFRQITDMRMEVTGGQLGRIDDHFQLVGGQRFIGRYNPMGPDFGPGFVQQYTNAIRKFRIDDDGTNMTIADYTEAVDTMELHRRDYNMVPQVFPDGSTGYTVFSGVFQYAADVPWLNTLDIHGSGWNVVPVFEQLLNQYHTAHAAFWDGSTNTMHTVFFGGIGRYYFDGNTLMDDPNVPFVNTISRVTRAASGALTESAIGSMPALLGASGEFIPLVTLPTAGEGIIRSDLLNGDSVLIGHIIGGIKSTAPNIFFINTGVESEASARVFEVYLVQTPTSIAESIDAGGTTLRVLPTTDEAAVRVMFTLPATESILLRIVDNTGRSVRTLIDGRAPAGEHELIVPVDQLAEGSYRVVLTSDGQQRSAALIR